MKNNMVIIDRVKVFKNGNSLCIILPKLLREEKDIKPGDAIVFMRSSNDAPMTITVDKKD